MACLRVSDPDLKSEIRFRPLLHHLQGMDMIVGTQHLFALFTRTLVSSRRGPFAVCIPVPEEAKPSPPLERLNFPGGLYATWEIDIPPAGCLECSSNLQQPHLSTWLQRSGTRLDPIRPWLAESLTVFHSDEEEPMLSESATILRANAYAPVLLERGTSQLSLWEG